MTRKWAIQSTSTQCAAFAFSALLSISSALGDDLNIATANRGSCYTPGKTHFHNFGKDVIPIGAAYFSYQNGYSYAVIDDGGAKGPVSGNVVDALGKFAYENRASNFLDCGSVSRCGGGRAQVCAVKMSSKGSFLPISKGERIPLSNVPSSSVEFFPREGFPHHGSPGALHLSDAASFPKVE